MKQVKPRITEMQVVAGANQLQGCIFRITGQWLSDPDETDASLLIELEDCAKYVSDTVRRYVKQERDSL